MKKRSHPLGARIKRLMQADDDVGKIASATPNLIGRAVELFLQKLCQSTLTVAQNRQARILTPAHLKAYVQTDKLMDFLKEIVSSAPDLGIEADANANPVPKLKRQRTLEPPEPSSLPSARGRGRPPTRGHIRGRGSRPRTTDSDSDISDSPRPPGSPAPHTAPNSHLPYSKSPFAPGPGQAPRSAPPSFPTAQHHQDPTAAERRSTITTDTSASTRDTDPHLRPVSSQPKAATAPPSSEPPPHPPPHHTHTLHSLRTSHPGATPSLNLSITGNKASVHAQPPTAPSGAQPVSEPAAAGASEREQAPQLLPIQMNPSLLAGYQNHMQDDDDYDDDYDS